MRTVTLLFIALLFVCASTASAIIVDDFESGSLSNWIAYPAEVVFDGTNHYALMKEDASLGNISSVLGSKDRVIVRDPMKISFDFIAETSGSNTFLDQFSVEIYTRLNLFDFDSTGFSLKPGVTTTYAPSSVFIGGYNVSLHLYGYDNSYSDSLLFEIYNVDGSGGSTVKIDNVTVHESGAILLVGSGLLGLFLSGNTFAQKKYVKTGKYLHRNL